MKIHSFIKSLIIILTSLLLMQSCKSDMNPQVSQRYDEVMAIHDEVMPLMSKTSKLRKSIKNHNHGDADKLVSDLTNADEYMMDWMKDFKVPKDQPVVDQLQFLDKMDQRAKVMQTMFDNAIKNAENYVNNHSH